MASKSNSNEVNVSDLKAGMIITAYTSFTSRYRPMDKPTADFVRHNFKNSRAVVSRLGEKRDIPIDKLEAGDDLIRLHSFPKDLKKLTHVSDPFVKELKKRGMVGFQVRQNAELTDESRKDLKELIKLVEKTTQQPRKGLSIVQQKRQERADIANSLVAKVIESAAIKQKASESMEYTMDQIRTGKTSIGEIRNFANQISKNGTADALSALTGLQNSDYIYAHSVEVGAIYQTIYQQVIEKKGTRSAFQSSLDVIMGALLHDLGKSKIPKEIIDSTDFFEKNSRATQIVRSHPKFGAEILKKLNMPDILIEMSLHHHVKLDTSMLSSYPADVDFKDIRFETRLLSIVDIYQALAGKRKYKKSWSPPATIRYLEALAGVEYDLKVWEQFQQVMGVYPKGSLVKLSDNSLGFVISVPGPNSNPERPMIAFIRNGRGETMSHADVIDLAVEKDIRITDDLDSHQIFGDRALDVFSSISVA